MEKQEAAHSNVTLPDQHTAWRNNANNLPSRGLSMEGDNSFGRSEHGKERYYFSIEKVMEEGCQIVQSLVDTLL